MTPDVRLLAYAAVLCWVMIMTAAMLKTRGIVNAGGNRDDLPDPSALAGRADRAAKNMLENLVLFTALLAAARMGNGDQDRIVLGARIFFWARVAYFPIYLAGIKHVRTVVWAVGIAGLALIFSAVL
ncbi:MAG TPA: MAPEG family protein [Kofleriaceae bacterium]